MVVQGVENPDDKNNIKNTTGTEVSGSPNRFGQDMVVLKDLTKYLSGAKVGSDFSVVFANSDPVNTVYKVDISKPTNPKKVYELITRNPSEVTPLLIKFYGKETDIAGNTRYSKLDIDDVLIPMKVPVAINKCYSYNASGAGTYTDETTDIGSATANDVAVPPIAQQDDAIYFGSTIPFYELKLTVGRAGVYVGTLVWEYYNGSQWVALTCVDGTATGGAPFKATAGVKYVTFDEPSDWAPVAVNSVTRYWIRCRCSAFTSVGTAPLITQGWVASTRTGSTVSNIIAGIFNGVDLRMIISNTTVLGASDGFTLTGRIKEVN